MDELPCIDKHNNYDPDKWCEECLTTRIDEAKDRDEE